MGTQLEVIKSKDNSKIIEFEVLYERSAAEHSARIIVSIKLCGLYVSLKYGKISNIRIVFQSLTTFYFDF